MGNAADTLSKLRSVPVTEELVVVSTERLREVFVKALRDVLSESESSNERPLTAKALASHFGCSKEQIYKWRDEGMPYFTTGDSHGFRAYLSKVRAWREESNGR